MSPRLAAIAAQVLVGEPMADIGTDHGLLPLFLLIHGIVPRAYGLDRSAMALAGAKQRGEALGWGEARGFSTLRSEGLAALPLGSVATAVLAGLGGGLICTILDAAPAWWAPPAALRRIVAQPNRDAYRVRAWALAHNWTLEDEALVVVDRRFYPTLTLRPLGPEEPTPVWDPADLAFGPLLRMRAPPELLADLRRQEAALEEALRESEDRALPATKAHLAARLAFVATERARIAASTGSESEALGTDEPQTEKQVL